MTYTLFTEKYVHPFIIYGVVGTLLCYLLVQGLARIGLVKGTRARVFVYSLPFLVPFAAYLIYRPNIYDRCLLHGHPLGVLNDWVCSGSNLLAAFLTPIFILVSAFALFKAGLSLYAVRRILLRYGFASREQYPKVFGPLEELAGRAGIALPRVIVTPDRFGRSFTMGYRRPVIVLSAGLLDALDAEELETVLAHELGHIDRADSLLNWVMVFLRDLMFFNPFIYWIFGTLQNEKEKAADDTAVRLTGKSMAFAQALIKVWRISPRSLWKNLALDNFSPHPNLVGHGILENRVRRLLNGDISSASMAPAACFIGLLAAAVAVWLLYWAC